MRGRSSAPVGPWPRASSVPSALLLRTPGIGPGVIRRLEAVGVASLGELAARGVDEVVANICAQQRTPAWGNRRAALDRALSSSAARGS